MALLLRLFIVGSLAVLSACGTCRDKLTSDGKHIKCADGCIETNDNNQKLHNAKDCSCSTSCPCMAVPAKPN